MNPCPPEKTSSAQKFEQRRYKEQQMNCEIIAQHAIATWVAGLGIDPKISPHAAFLAVNVIKRQNVRAHCCSARESKRKLVAD